MKRVKKAVLLPVRNIAYRWKSNRLYYWTESKLFELQAVYVLPIWYYRRLYHICMFLAEFKKFRHLADRAIHTIPYHVRFEVA